MVNQDDLRLTGRRHGMTETFWEAWERIHMFFTVHDEVDGDIWLEEPIMAGVIGMGDDDMADEQAMSETKPTLAEYLEGDLGPARRHLQRIKMGTLNPTPGVLNEISRSIERCVERIQRDVPPLERPQGVTASTSIEDVATPEVDAALNREDEP